MTTQHRCGHCRHYLFGYCQELASRLDRRSTRNMDVRLACKGRCFAKRALDYELGPFDRKIRKHGKEKYIGWSHYPRYDAGESCNKFLPITGEEVVSRKLRGLDWWDAGDETKYKKSM